MPLIAALITAGKTAVAAVRAPEPPPSTPPTPQLRETLILALMLAAFIVINTLTATWYPAPFLDEVMYTDPSVNLYTGRGFVSTAWPAQSGSELWAGNSPLHEVILYGWLKVLGFSPVIVRSLGAVLMALAVWLFWLAAIRLSLLARPATRLAFCALLLTGAGTTYVAHFGRPDAITFILTTGTLLAASIRDIRPRSVMLFALAFCYPIAGMQLVAYAGILCMLLWLFLGTKFLRAGIPIAGGVVTGFIALLAFYAMHGVVMVFLTSTVASGHSLSGDLAQLVVLGDAKVRGRVQGRADALLSLWTLYRLDPSFLPLLITAAAAQFGLRRAAVSSRVSSFCLVAGLVVGPAMLLAGKYPFYYTWMGFLPLALSASRGVEDLWAATRSRTLLTAVSAPAFFAAFVGLPWILWTAPVERKHDLDRIEAFVQQNIQPTDWVYGRPTAYYAVKALTGEFFHDQYAGSRRFSAIPEAERRRISVILTSPDQFPAAAAKLGGEWQQTGQVLRLAHPTLPDPATINGLIASTQQVALLNVDLHLYRRTH